MQVVAGGLITGIVAHPLQQNLFYARTDIGGAYRRTGTGNWMPLQDWINSTNWNLYGVESIGLDPADANRLYLLVGTYIQSWAGNGAVLISTDQGSTFTTVNLPFKVGGNEDGRQAGERLAVDPNDGSVLYLGTRTNGLYKSTDHGATWAQVTTFPVGTSTASDGVGVVFVKYLESSGTAGSVTPVIYVGVSSASAYSSLYRSIDGGVNWSVVPNQPTGYYINHADFNPDGNLYASYGNAPGPNNMTTGRIYRYTPPANSTPNGNGTWTNITPPAPSYSNNGSYGFGTIVVDPSNSGVIMASTMDLWYQHDDLWRSIDGGNTWIEMSVEGKASYSFTNAPWMVDMQDNVSTGMTAGPGWWIGAMCIDPYNAAHVMYGTGATLWESSDVTNINTASAVNWSIGGTGIEETAVTGLISPSSGAHLVSALGDISGFVHTNLDVPMAHVLKNPQFGATRGIDFAEQAPAIMARVGDASSVANSGGFSLDGGTSWTPFPSQPGVTSVGSGKVAVAANGGVIVWAPSYGSSDSSTGRGVFYSTNNGTSWTQSTNAPAQTTPIADRINGTKFYIVSGTSLYRSTNGAVSFSVASTLPASGSLFASTAAEGDLWLATSSGLYRSTNSGTSFTAVSGISSATYLGFGMAATGASYPAVYMYGTINGTQAFYRSVDGGASWVRINDDAHQYGTVSVVVGDPRVFGRVYIGTNGRGIIYGDSTT